MSLPIVLRWRKPALLALSCILSACGIKGALYFEAPPKNTAGKAPAATSTAAALPAPTASVPTAEPSTR